MCIKVRLQRLGNTRKVSTSQVEVDTDKALIRVSKHLIDSAELRQITNFDAEVRRYLCNTCLPFDVGIHLCPFALLEQVEGRLRKFAEDRQSLVAAFLTAYPALCHEAATRLRTLYNPQDYPPIEYVRGQFGFTWQYMSFGVPEQLREISTRIWGGRAGKGRRSEASGRAKIP